MIIPLYTCYYIPNNAQVAFSISDIKKYCNFLSTRVEALSQTRLVDKHGKIVRIISDKEWIK